MAVILGEKEIEVSSRVCDHSDLIFIICEVAVINVSISQTTVFRALTRVLLNLLERLDPLATLILEGGTLLELRGMKVSCKNENMT
jgi:hypothetical protein